jgi:hypothetical protein
MRRGNLREARASDNLTNAVLLGAGSPIHSLAAMEYWHPAYKLHLNYLEKPL